MAIDGDVITFCLRLLWNFYGTLMPYSLLSWFMQLVRLGFMVFSF